MPSTHTRGLHTIPPWARCTHLGQLYRLMLEVWPEGCIESTEPVEGGYCLKRMVVNPPEKLHLLYKMNLPSLRHFNERKQKLALNFTWHEVLSQPYGYSEALWESSYCNSFSFPLSLNATKLLKPAPVGQPMRVLLSLCAPTFSLPPGKKVSLAHLLSSLQGYCLPCMLRACFIAYFLSLRPTFVWGDSCGCPLVPMT